MGKEPRTSVSNIAVLQDEKEDDGTDETNSVTNDPTNRSCENDSPMIPVIPHDEGDDLYETHVSVEPDVHEICEGDSTPIPSCARVSCDVIEKPESPVAAVVNSEKLMLLLFRFRMFLFFTKSLLMNILETVFKFGCDCLHVFKKFCLSCNEVFTGRLSCETCLSVTCEIDGKTIKLLLDTGSQVSVVCSKWYDKWRTVLPLERDSTRLRCVGGTYVAVNGMFTGKLSLGSSEWEVPWLVADIGSGSLGVEGILGMDVLAKMRAVLDLEKKELILPNVEVGCADVSARVVGTSVLESGKAMNVRVTSPEMLGVFEPSVELAEKCPGLLVARVVAEGNNDAVVIPVINVSAEDIKLSDGVKMGTWEPVREGQSAPEVDNPSGNLPECLHELLERSSVGLCDSERRELRECLRKYHSVFAQSDEDLGRTELVRHEIDTGEGRPIKQHPRRLPMMMRDVEQQEVNRMLSQNIIVPSSSPWASPTVMVKKKDGKIRFCVDYRKLNELSKKDAYPLPRIDDCIDNLDGAKYFCTLDLQSGYWQVMMDPKDQEKTAFCTRSGLYEFKVMPFGLTNAVATFERLMETVLRGLQWNECLVYLDDIIVFGATFEQTLERLMHVFDRLHQAGLKLKPTKCTLFAGEVNFLGHVISKDGVRTQSSKIEAVQEWPVPRNAKDVRSFLGLAGYYRRFIKNYAKIARPLHKLTSTQVKFSWDEECQNAFDTLKGALTSAPILGYPRQEGQMILDTDASGLAVGAVMSQLQDGKEVVLAYMSKSLTPAETNYCITRKEMLAVVTAVRTWRPYLLGREVILRTDNSAVAWAKRIKQPIGQMARWLQELGCLDLKEQHRPGRVHWNADALSRRSSVPCKQCHREDGSCSGQTAGSLSAALSAEDGVTLEPEWKTEELREEQMADSTIRPVLTALEGERRPAWSEVSGESEEVKALMAMWDRLVIRDGVLCRKFVEDDGESFYIQLVVPRIRVGRLLQMAHDDPLGGHFGFERTLKKLKAFYWIGMRKNVKEHCGKCELCMARKPKQKNIRAPMKVFLTCAPMERVTVDIMGPLDRSAAGNKYVLVVTDTFTKYTEAYALRNIEAKTVARKIVEEWICRFGAMRIIHSDQGRQFESRLFAEVCKLLGIRKTHTTPWRPKANGQVERFNRTLGTMLCIYAQEETKYWDKHLPFITSAYRAAKHEATGLTPNLMMFGREVMVPLSLVARNVGSQDPLRVLDADEYVQQLSGVFEKAYRFARDRLKKDVETRKRRYDVGTARVQFNVGQAVWLYDPTKVPGRSPKFQAPWKKGWRIKKKIDDIHYVIENYGRCRVIHADRLFPKQD
jgi:hypothetical protein